MFGRGFRDASRCDQQGLVSEVIREALRAKHSSCGRQTEHNGTDEQQERNHRHGRTLGLRRVLGFDVLDRPLSKLRLSSSPHKISCRGEGQGTPRYLAAWKARPGPRLRHTARTSSPAGYSPRPEAARLKRTVV